MTKVISVSDLLKLDGVQFILAKFLSWYLLIIINVMLVVELKKIKAERGAK